MTDLTKLSELIQMTYLINPYRVSKLFTVFECPLYSCPFERGYLTPKIILPMDDVLHMYILQATDNFSNVTS